MLVDLLLQLLGLFVEVLPLPFQGFTQRLTSLLHLVMFRPVAGDLNICFLNGSTTGADGILHLPKDLIQQLPFLAQLVDLRAKPIIVGIQLIETSNGQVQLPLQLQQVLVSLRLSVFLGTLKHFVLLPLLRVLGLCRK